MENYNVFVRDWWKEATEAGWPNNLEPGPGPKEYLAYGVTYAEARAMCKEYNESHESGRYSRKAEFEEE